MQNVFGKSTGQDVDGAVAFLIALLACSVAFWMECNTTDPFFRANEAIRDAFLQMSVSAQPETRLDCHRYQ